MNRGTDATRRSRVVYLAAAWCLSYPDAELVGRVPLIRAALSEFDAALPDFTSVLGHLENTQSMDLQAHYVREFDLGRRHSLHLSYWTDGDTRRRGEVLGGFKEAYRRSDVLVDLDGELPDYLPMVLEYAARVDFGAGHDLLVRYRPSLEMLRLGLLRDALPHAGVLAAVCATLPGKSPQDEQAVMRMAGLGPPTEAVGLDPYDPRLIPVRKA